MNIQEQFNLVAEDYDKNRKIFIPCFDDFYKNSTKIIAENISAPKKIMDLGAGTGLLSYFWRKFFPDAKYFLVDVAKEMLKIAQKRFSADKNIFYHVADYQNNFPEKNFDAIISALSIHHLTDSDKQNLFQKIYEKLPANGIFVNYDQFLAENPEINDWYNIFWEKHMKNNLSRKDLDAWRERKKFDKECSVEQEIKMLKNCGFKIVECIYKNQKFAVIFAGREAFNGN